MRNFVFVAVSVLSFISCQALADQVSLKNGDRLSGTIVKSDGKDARPAHRLRQRHNLKMGSGSRHPVQRGTALGIAGRPNRRRISRDL